MIRLFRVQPLVRVLIVKVSGLDLVFLMSEKKKVNCTVPSPIPRWSSLFSLSYHAADFYNIITDIFKPFFQDRILGEENKSHSLYQSIPCFLVNLSL